MELMFQPFRKYADFQGRARRSEYWLFLLLMFALVLPCGLITEFGETTGQPVFEILGSLATVVVILGSLVPWVAVRFRRLHDINRTAWWVVIGVIPVIGLVVLTIFSLLDGTPGPNRFGPDPKGRGQGIVDPPHPA
jgi:uncharacterized membrane protein YhaH (DUF805 family)